jgi:hypothetical protein
LICHCESQTEIGVESGSPPVATPALLNSTSTGPPRRRSLSATMACTSASRARSQGIATPPISLATLRAPSAFTSTTATFAPRFANARALAAPMPLAAPVMIATLSFRSMICLLVAGPS